MLYFHTKAKFFLPNFDHNLSFYTCYWPPAGDWPLAHFFFFLCFQMSQSSGESYF